MAIRFGSAMPNLYSARDPRATGGFCPSCGNPLTVSGAAYCRNCGAPVTPVIWFKTNLEWNPWLALFVSILPGAGQVYKGYLFQGLAWLVLVAVSYTAQPLGVILHLLCAANAALSGAIDSRPLQLRRTSVRQLFGSK